VRRSGDDECVCYASSERADDDEWMLT